MFRVLTVICAFIWADHANAGGLGDFLKAIESLDQSIQGKVQDALVVPEPDNRQAQEEQPGTKVTTTPVTSNKIQIKVQPGVAKESADTEEEEEEDDEDEPNLISSEKIRLKPDMILKEGSTGETGTSEPGGVVKTGTSVGDGDNRQADVPSQASTVSVTNEGEPGGEGEILWLGTATHRFSRALKCGGLHLINSKREIRLRETTRVDILNDEKRLTGQLVRLVDAGGTWFAEQSGTDTCGCNVVNYAGSGGGDSRLGTAGPNGQAPVRGWVYYSMDTADPLGDLIANGTYHIASHESVPNASVITRIHCDGSIARMNLPLTPWVFFSKHSTIPDPHPGMPPVIQAGELRPYVRFSGLQQHGQGAFGDPIVRVIAEGRMAGFYATAYDGEGRQIATSIAPNDGVPLPSYPGFLHRAQWNIERVLGVDATLEVVKKNWRPEHDNEANTLSVTASVEQPAIPAKFRFTLFEVTREKGWAMNAGGKDDDSLDLEFLDGLAGFLSPEETSDGWEIEANRTMTTATVVVKANDYGAWGKLKCEVNVDGHWWPCKSDDGGGYVTIPHDEDENKIADFWEEDKGVSGDAAADDDETPEGREPGDGFSNYEEYRGFQIEGTWRDTDPTEKDLFVHNTSGLAEIESAIDEFEIKTELAVHKISEDEFDRATRIVNFNRGSKQALSRRGNGQKGLLVIVRQLDDVCGEAVSDHSTGAVLGGPNITKEVVIDPSCLLDTTAIHELGHGVNLWHPGGRYLDQCGEKIIAGLRTPYAGPMKNYMRYEYAGKYIGPDNKCYKYPSHLEIVPSSFTKTLRGTGMNSGPPDRWEYDTLDGVNYPYPVSADATCSGTLIDKSMSLNQDARPAPGGC
jgi:hypothetical protein|tara:strand:- start:2928 stop:5504 length:2577 start_codon:yes stop_codon:yes gene_type:complete